MSPPSTHCAAGASCISKYVYDKEGASGDAVSPSAQDSEPRKSYVDISGTYPIYLRNILLSARSLFEFSINIA